MVMVVVVEMALADVLLFIIVSDDILGHKQRNISSIFVELHPMVSKFLDSGVLLAAQ